MKNGCKYKLSFKIQYKNAINDFNKIHLGEILQPQKGKQGTKGSKQIVEENAATLKFYQYMAAGSTTIFFIINFLFFEFTGTVSVSNLWVENVLKPVLKSILKSILKFILESVLKSILKSILKSEIKIIFCLLCFS